MIRIHERTECVEVYIFMMPLRRIYKKIVLAWQLLAILMAPLSIWHVPCNECSECPRVTRLDCVT